MVRLVKCSNCVALHYVYIFFDPNLTTRLVCLLRWTWWPTCWSTNWPTCWPTWRWTRWPTWGQTWRWPTLWLHGGWQGGGHGGRHCGYMVADKEVDMVADMEVDKVADMVADMAADKKNGWHGVGHGGRHGGGQGGRQSGRHGGWHVQNQVYNAWYILKQSLLGRSSLMRSVSIQLACLLSFLLYTFLRLNVWYGRLHVLKWIFLGNFPIGLDTIRGCIPPSLMDGFCNLIFLPLPLKSTKCLIWPSLSVGLLALVLSVRWCG